MPWLPQKGAVAEAVAVVVALGGAVGVGPAEVGDRDWELVTSEPMKLKSFVNGWLRCAKTVCEWSRV